MGDGGINVQTIKLNSPAKKPIKVPALGPKSCAVMMTGIIPRVATIGPNAGSAPRGVKQNIIKIASRAENCVRVRVLLFCIAVTFLCSDETFYDEVYHFRVENTIIAM